MEKGIKTSTRVREYGEVFTPDSTVMAMIKDINKRFRGISDDEYISKTYLEPTCGDGQFLVRILWHKLKRIPSDADQSTKELMLVKSLCSIYGVDIQQDNVEEAKERLYKLATGESVKTFDLNKDLNIKVNLGIEYSEKLIKVIRFILDTNIICGNTLANFSEYEKSKDIKEPEIIFTGYDFNGELVTTWQSALHNELVLCENKPIHYLELPNAHNELDLFDEFDY